MLAKTPAIYCDAEDGMCGAWDLDYYAQCASTVNGVRISSTERAPGWLSSLEADLCPEHAPTPADPERAALTEGSDA